MSRHVELERSVATTTHGPKPVSWTITHDFGGCRPAIMTLRDEDMRELIAQYRMLGGHE